MLRIGMFLGGRYEILEQIGVGGMAEVYKAKDHKLNRLVAIKVLKKEFAEDSVFIDKFRVEAQSAAGLIHPNIVNIYDVGKENDIHYIVMELVDGITLKELIQRKGKLEIRESIGVAMQIAQGVEAAHEHGIVHRDIKPQNIIISKDGKVKVTDFGIARAASTQTISSNTMGSVHYISPEQARGGYCDERSDIYSLGITLYEMLTGRLPFEGDSTVSIALQHIQGDMVPPSTYESMIPVSLEKIIMKCTQKKPEMRYSSATALIADLKKALMTPDDDFVKVIPLVTDSPTLIMSEADTNRIKEEVKKTPVQPASDEDEDELDERTEDEKAEEAYLMGLDEDDDEEDLDEYEDEDDDKKVEKIVMGVGIGVAVIIVILAIYVLGKALGIFSYGTVQETESSSSSASTESVSAADMVTMPDTVGKDETEAIKLLNDAGLGVRKEYDSDETGTYENGQVMYQQVEINGQMQDIAAGSSLERNTQITLIICENDDMQEIPSDIIGMSRTTAERSLVLLEFVVEVVEQPSDDVESGLVIDCNPTAGTSAPTGTTVTLYVSSGPAVKMVSVPNVVGSEQTEAENTLKNAGLSVTVESANSDTVASGRVISQGTDAGTEVEEGTTIRITVSAGPAVRTYTVPSNLVGMSLSDAQSALNNAGITNVEVVTQTSDTTKDQVLSVSPAGGTTIQEGDKVTLTVSSGPEQVTVPNFVGSTKDGVNSLAAGNFTITYSSETVTTEDQSMDGIVARQSIASGNNVNKGSEIVLTLYTYVAPTTTQPPTTEAPTTTQPPSAEAPTTQPPAANGPSETPAPSAASGDAQQ